MSKVLIVYHSLSGNTGKMAEAVAEGVRDAGSEAFLKDASEANAEDMINCDAVAIGTANYFSYMSGIVKDWFDRIWFSVIEKISGKPFACFGSYGGGGPVAIETVEKICEGGKMKKVSGCVHCSREPSSDVLEKCKALGRKLALV